MFIQRGDLLRSTAWHEAAGEHLLHARVSATPAQLDQPQLRFMEGQHLR